MSVPNRIHISWVNWLALYTLASDVDAEAAYPLTNLQNAHRSHWAVFDMTGETAVAITGSSATARAANCWAMHNHDAPDGTTIRVRLYADEGQTGTAVYDSTATDVMHNIPFGSVIAGIDGIEGNFEDEGHLTTHISRFFDTVTFKSFQIDIANAGGFTDDVLTIDKLWLGFAWTPTYGIANGWQSSILDDSEHLRKPGGGMDTVDGALRRSLRLRFDPIDMPDSERHVIRHILDRATLSGDLLVAVDPNDVRSKRYETTSIYRRTSNMTFTSAFYNGNGFGLDLEEN